jgi:hypothetical protein
MMLALRPVEPCLVLRPLVVVVVVVVLLAVLARRRLPTLIPPLKP